MSEPTDLIYGRNSGCVAAVSVSGGTPGQCGRAEAYAVPRRYRYPHPEATRLYVCAFHAKDRPGVEPLTAEDRATIAGRRAHQRAQLERAGRLDLIGE